MKKQTETKGIIGFILSIISALLVFMPYFGIFFSIAGIVLSGLQIRSKSTGLAIAGLTIGIIITAISVIMIGLLIVIFATL